MMEPLKKERLIERLRPIERLKSGLGLLKTLDESRIFMEQNLTPVLIAQLVFYYILPEPTDSTMP